MADLQFPPILPALFGGGIPTGATPAGPMPGANPLQAGESSQLSNPETEVEGEVMALLEVLAELLLGLEGEGAGGGDPFGGGAFPGGGGVPASGGGGGVPPSGGGIPSYGAPSHGGGAPASHGSGGAAPIQSGGGSGTASGPAPTGGTTPGNAPPPPGGTHIGPGNNVLMIGDSHTVGAFGDELTNKLRGTGAKVSSYGSSGSSPSWWLNGTQTTSGFIGRHADGSVDQPADWRSPHATPNLEQLIQQQHPDTLVVNLGANFRGASPQQIKQQVDGIGKVAQQNHVRLIWVGPPRQQSDMGNSAGIDAFNQQLAQDVKPYGTYIASSPYTSYNGPDGIHYNSGPARSWADQVYNQIQG